MKIRGSDEKIGGDGKNGMESPYCLKRRNFIWGKWIVCIKNLKRIWMSCNIEYIIIEDRGWEYEDG